MLARFEHHVHLKAKVIVANSRRLVPINGQEAVSDGNASPTIFHDLRPSRQVDLIELLHLQDLSLVNFLHHLSRD